MQTKDKLFVGTLAGALAWIPVACHCGLMRDPVYWLVGPVVMLCAAWIVLVVGSYLHFVGCTAWLHVCDKCLKWRHREEYNQNQNQKQKEKTNEVQMQQLR